MLAEGAAGADGLIGAPIGAPVCAQTGAAIARAAAIVTPFNRCFMPLPLITLGMGTMRCEGWVTWWPLPGLGQKQPLCCVVPASTQRAVFAYPARRSMKNMVGANRFPAPGSCSIELVHLFHQILSPKW